MQDKRRDDAATFLTVERVQTIKPKNNSSPPAVAAAAGTGGSVTASLSTIDGNPYILVSPVTTSKFSMEVVLKAVSRCGKKLEDSTRKAGEVAEGVWRHLNTNPNLTEAAMTRLLQGTKVLIDGGYDKIFQQVFGFVPGEKLQVAYVCYLSTSSGPVMGTIYISTARIAFCSDNPLHRSIAPGHQELIYYKVILPFENITAINSSSNKANPADKYIQITTRDGYEFWFMGFVSYDKAFKSMKEAIKY